MNYLVADFIIRLKNASSARRRDVVLPYSKLNLHIGKVLVKEQFLEEIKEATIDGKKALTAKVLYVKRTPAISEVVIISKPSLRKYAGATGGLLLGRGIGTNIVSTNQGIMTGKEALKKGIGGELLFRIW